MNKTIAYNENEIIKVVLYEMALSQHYYWREEKINHWNWLLLLSSIIIPAGVCDRMSGRYLGKDIPGNCYHYEGDIFENPQIGILTTQHKWSYHYFDTRENAKRAFKELMIDCPKLKYVV